MSNYVNEQIATNYAERGKLVAKGEPTRETKGTWFQVYELDGKYCAVVFDETWGASCGEEITKDEVSNYV